MPPTRHLVTLTDVYIYNYIHCTVFLRMLCCFALLFVCLTVLASFFLSSHLSLKHVYRKPGNTSTGTSIRRLCICAVRIAWGTYNHGVLLNEIKNTVI